MATKGNVKVEGYLHCSTCHKDYPESRCKSNVGTPSGNAKEKYIIKSFYCPKKHFSVSIWWDKKGYFLWNEGKEVTSTKPIGWQKPKKQKKRVIKSDDKSTNKKRSSKKTNNKQTKGRDGRSIQQSKSKGKRKRTSNGSVKKSRVKN